MKKMGLVFCLLMLVNSILFGAYIQIGDGSESTSYIPAYGFYRNGWSSTIYPQIVFIADLCSNIFENIYIDDIFIIDSLETYFTADRTNILSGESVNFTDLTYGNSNQWKWYLNNNELPDSYLQNPSFNYYTSGTYSISLVVSNIDYENNVVASDSVMFSDYIHVEGTPITEGNYLGTWTVDLSPYNVLGEVSVSIGDTLIIEEGTLVNFMEDTEFIVEGGLIADGVIFGSAESNLRDVTRWNGLKFNSSSGNSSLTNSVIKNAKKAIEIDEASPHLSGLIIEGVDSEQPAIKIIGSSQATLDNIDIDKFNTGIEVLGDSSDDVPVLTNIRIRHTTNTTRNDNDGVAVKIQDSNTTINDLVIEGFSKGIEIKSTSDASTTPVLTNIRIRHTTNTARTDDSYALQVKGNSSPIISNTEIDDFSKGIVFNALNSSTTPTLTNIRIRHTTNTLRNVGVGITLNNQANAWLKNSHIEGFAVGVKAEGNNNANIERNAIIDNLVAFDLSGADCNTQIHHNHIQNSLEELVTCFVVDNINDLQILNNTIIGFSRVVSGQNSSPYFSQNIIWGTPIVESDLASSELVNATFEYNDISMVSGFAPGLGNINEDPQFVESEDNYNLQLSIYSNCIDAGNPNLAPDPDGSTADLGMNYIHHLANFESDYRFVTLGTPIQFTNNSEGHNHESSTILWEFGDGQTSTLREPSHTYSEIGLYTTTLTMDTGSYTDVSNSTFYVVIQEDAIPAPQYPLVTMTGDSANLTWNQISETIAGEPIDRISYLIYSSDDIDGRYEFRDIVNVLNWTDANIGQHADKQFYFILGYVANDRTSIEDFIRTHRYLRRNGEIVKPSLSLKPKIKKQN